MCRRQARLKSLVVTWFMVLACVVALPIYATPSFERHESVLAEQSQDITLPIEQRIAATQMLGNYTGANAIIAIGRASRSATLELRLASIYATQRWQGRAKWDVVAPLLNDDAPEVQALAVRTLAPLWRQVPERYRQILNPAIDDQLMKVQDTANGRLDTAWFYRMRQQYTEAEQLLLLETELNNQPNVVMALAALYQDTKQESRSLDVLEQGVSSYPDSSMLHQRLALTYWRTQQYSAAIEHMQVAYQIEIESAAHAYLLGLMLAKQQPEQAIGLFEKAYGQQAEPQYLYSLCETKLALTAESAACLNELSKWYPEPALRALTEKYDHSKLSLAEDR
ncbi:hypothetical protein MD535_10155 [Vibrio sp. ZSDZ65]|uniref:Tetratricopeptide repeat protein n=1 Tax=Vibrio qingdaonensis TaxID=2829491 RepID=A0A9X3CMZ6_9VIBR|nr:hypothetical protein [Vibrio qingdaonensis]MCW8346363.1 hypothetical protein [Vibrio qingdaonensis]